jgi:S1-C subfamily serine protease
MAARRLGAALLLAVLLPAASPAVPARPSTAWPLEQVKALSAEEMEGRASGTPGAERAARHIAGVFERAGVQPGDVIVRFDGADVQTLEDLTSALRDRRAGDRGELVVRRDGRDHTLSAVLETRR